MDQNKHIIKFNLHRGDKLISRAIRLVSPRYNHVSILMGDTIYEAQLFQGVIKTHRSEWADSDTVARQYVLEVDGFTYAKILQFLEKQVGKDYDYLGIFAHIFPVLLAPRIGAWYCSELANVVMYKIAGLKMSYDTLTNKVSPFVFSENIRIFTTGLYLGEDLLKK